MNITSVKLIAFSPTGTTTRVLTGIAEGIGAFAVESLDLTPPGARAMDTVELREEPAIIGLSANCRARKEPERYP